MKYFKYMSNSDGDKHEITAPEFVKAVGAARAYAMEEDVMLIGNPRYAVVGNWSYRVELPTEEE